MKERRKKRLAGKVLADAIQNLCSGMAYVSETDAPINGFFVPMLKEENLIKTIQRSFDLDPDVHGESPTDLFDKLTATREWHGTREKANVHKFAKLRRALEDNLTELTLFRSGRIRIDIIVAGIDAEGNVIGIKTKAVET